MLTAEILVKAGKGQARGFSRPADLVPLYNTVVQVLYNHEHPQTLLRSASTGLLPTLSTTQGNMGPYYGPTNAWRVSNVLIWAEDIGMDYGLEYDYVDESDVVEVNGNQYYVYRYASSDDAVEVGPNPPVGVEARPIIRFSQDPGTTTRRYYMQAYRKHPLITSDRIQTLIPDSDGTHETILVPGLMKLIEGQNHGNYMEAIEYIEQTLKPRLWARMSAGAQGKRHRTTGRPY
jgi:hypothetical protein